MKNIWLIRGKVRNEFPTGSRVTVTGPFLADKLNDILYTNYIGQLGTVVSYTFGDENWPGVGGLISWIGVILDANQGKLGNVTSWFDPSEIQPYVVDQYEW